MRFVPIQSYNTYIDAHIAMGRLKDAGVECWLQDENTVTTDPILTLAVGGIKLLVKDSDEEEARKLLREFRKVSHSFQCPACGSKNVEVVTTPRKMSNWISALLGFFLGSYAFGVDAVYHCFDCGTETPIPVEAPE